MSSENPLTWEYHQVDHLFLLIGENPLPNYVAAKTLLRKGGKAYLVYTKYTSNAYERLKKVLDLSEEEKVELWNNESNAFEIQKAIKDKVKEIQQQDSNKKRFGLNYTGGTKAMAVHAYQALLDPNLRLAEEPRFSYLDSRSLQMMFDQKNNRPIPLEVPKEKLEITGETLFSLHGLRWKGDQPISRARGLDAAKKLIALYINIIEKNEKLPRNQPDNIDNTAREWQNWCQQVMNPKTWEYKKDKKYSDWKDEETLDQVELDFTTAPTQIKNILISDLIVSYALKLSEKQVNLKKITMSANG